MGDARNEGGRDWRRKLSGTSSTKSSGKESRAKITKSNTSEAIASSPASRTLTSPNRSTPTSPNAKSSSTHKSRLAEVDYEPPVTPIFGSVPGGFRTNIFRSGRERTASNQDVSQTDRKKPGLGTASPREGDFSEGRGKASGAFSSAGVVRSASTSPREAETPSPYQEGTSGDLSADEDGRRDGKRGSVIEKVAQKAKLVLPLKRTKELGKSESSRSLAAKSTASSSSMQSSPRLGVNNQESSSEEDDEEDDDANDSPGRSRTGSSQADRKTREGLTTSAEEDGGLSPTTNTQMDSPKEGSPSEGTSPQNMARPKTVPPRIMSPDTIHQRNGLSVATAAPAKKGTKMVETSISGSKMQDGKALPLRSPKSINSLHAARQKKPSMNSIREVSLSAPQEDTNGISSPRISGGPQAPGRPNVLRNTSAMKMSSSFVSGLSKASLVASNSKTSRRVERRPPSFEPPLPDLDKGPKVDSAPPTGMYWSRAPCFGYDHAALRAHTVTLIGSNVYIFGGCDAKACFNDMYVFDADCLFWSTPECTGDIPPPLRAMTATAVGKKIIIFGGGDGATYCNDIYVLDTLNFRYTKSTIHGTQPCKRRAHTACLYRGGIYVFGGGDGERALNDVWRLDVSDVSKLSWKMISPPSKANPGRPTARGYHTANMVGSKMIIFGGSDGAECFRDVWVFDVETLMWRFVDIKLSFPRLSHTATVVGSYLFVVGGHDGVEYSSDVLLLNLVTMQWDRRKTYGSPPSGRGYHGTVLHDSRLFVMGGFDGHTVFDDTFTLELAVSAYYSQISHFTIDV